MAVADAVTKKPSKAATLSAARKYLAAEEQVEELQRQIDAFRREQKIALATCSDFLAGDGEVCLTGGIRVFASEKKGNVAWKDEVIRLQGAEYALKL